MTFTQILAILRARWLAATVVFTLIFGGIVGVTLWLPKQYSSTATVLLDFKNSDPITGQNFGGVVPISFVVTQVDVIRSGRVVQQVIDRLRLRDNEGLRAEYAESSAAATTTYEAWLVELLRDRDRLDIRPTKDSGALNITFTSPDPGFAAALANAFAESYIATSVQLRNEPARQSGTFFDTQARSAKEAYEAAQAKLSEYQQRNGLVATDERYDVEMSRLQELSSQQVALQAVAAEARNRDAQARTKGSDTQEVLNNGLLASLTADLNRQQARLEELAQRLGPSHPSYIDAKVAADELQRRIADETRRVTSSV
ncbi:MAG: chain length determinant protein EpsF, partial [Rubrivivax sp.]